MTLAETYNLSKSDGLAKHDPGGLILVAGDLRLALDAI